MNVKNSGNKCCKPETTIAQKSGYKCGKGGVLVV